MMILTSAVKMPAATTGAAAAGTAGIPVTKTGKEKYPVAPGTIEKERNEGFQMYSAN